MTKHYLVVSMAARVGGRAVGVGNFADKPDFALGETKVRSARLADEVM
jgi:hypothetical protein